MTTIRHDYVAEPESVGRILARLADTEKRPAEAGREGTMTCPRCSTANADGAQFCSSCGNQLTMPGTYQSAARGAIVSQNLALVGLVGLVLGFIGGGLVGAYVFVPMGGWGAVLGVASPIIGMVVGQRLLMQALAK